MSNPRAYIEALRQDNRLLTAEIERLTAENLARMERNVELDAIRRELLDIVARLEAKLIEIDREVYTPSFLRAIALSAGAKIRHEDDPVSKPEAAG
jgi:hypothetical protein